MSRLKWFEESTRIAFEHNKTSKLKCISFKLHWKSNTKLTENIGFRFDQPQIAKKKNQKQKKNLPKLATLRTTTKSSVLIQTKYQKQNKKEIWAQNSKSKHSKEMNRVRNFSFLSTLSRFGQRPIFDFCRPFDIFVGRREKCSNNGNIQFISRLLKHHENGLRDRKKIMESSRMLWNSLIFSIITHYSSSQRKEEEMRKQIQKISSTHRRWFHS